MEDYGRLARDTIGCNRDLFRYDFAIQVNHNSNTFTFNTFPSMNMCREETYKWSKMLGTMSCEPLLYMWGGPISISDEVQAILDDIGEDVFTTLPMAQMSVMGPAPLRIIDGGFTSGCSPMNRSPIECDCVSASLDCGEKTV